MAFAVSFLGKTTRLQALSEPDWQGWGARVFMKREDERDVLLGGNKWCKLQGWLAVAREAGVSRLVSVGGRWSNHLHALAHAGQRFGFETVGIVRAGEEPTPTLRDALAAGMALYPVSREEYRRRDDPEWQAEISRRFDPCLFIPEGGFGAHAQPGLAALAAELEAQVAGDVLLALPVGSGTTLLGLRRALPARFRLLGFQAFADPSLAGRLAGLLGDDQGWQLRETAAMRRHHVLPADLAAFMRDFEHRHGIPLDPVYTVRMMAALQPLLRAGEIAGTTVIALHSGGLQGRRGLALAPAA